VELVGVVSDPDGDALRYAWSDDCGGTFGDVTSLTPEWTAPNTPGAKCVLTLAVEEVDGLGQNDATFTLHVAEPIWIAATWLFDQRDVWNQPLPAGWVRFETVTSEWQADGSLLLEKRGSGSDATSAGVGISGIPAPFTSLSFDIVSGECVGGAPRFNVYLDGATSPCFLGCNNVTPVGTTYTFEPGVNGCGAPGQMITGLDLMVDWPAGPVVLGNIKVNGSLVVH
jgi:hypothetical protein